MFEQINVNEKVKNITIVVAAIAAALLIYKILCKKDSSSFDELENEVEEFTNE